MSSGVEAVLKRDRALLVSAIALLFLLSGLYTVYGVGMNMSAVEMTAMSGMKDMPGPASPGDWPVAYAVLVFLMWWVMMIAMMLPSVAPTILLYAALLRHAGKTANVPLTANIFLTGYLFIWAVFSALAGALQWGLEYHSYVSATMMTLISSFWGGMVLLAAGVFQFSPLKAACLEHCRTPAQFLAERNRPGFVGAFQMGVEHGVYCLGCCWFLMVLLFVGGIMNLFWIVGLAAYVAVEKLTGFGERVSKIVGAILMGWGVYVMIGNVI